MLYRKIESEIRGYLSAGSTKMLIVDGARQVGKSYIIRHVGKDMFSNYIEVNMEEDKLRDRLFAEVRSVNDFYLALSTIAGDRLGNRDDTLVFIDEIQVYPQLLTLAKFLVADGRFTYIASGSQLGVTLQETQSIPMGSIDRLHMYPLDFEEFLIANKVGVNVIEVMKENFEKKVPLSEAIHNKIMDLFRRYLLIGGLPECVDSYLKDINIFHVRQLQDEIHDLYMRDAAKYESDSGRKLKIRRIYSMIPSNLENKKKRVVAKDIEGKKGKRMTDYDDEFDYLISAGIALDVKAISQPVYPLVQNAGKNLLKLYLNDVGMLTGILYKMNIKPVLDDITSVNLGSVYESVVAQELKAHGFELYYYDNKKNGEVDYLVDDSENVSVLPIEVKSGKDYRVHSALDKFLSNKGYGIKKGIVLSNEREIISEDGIDYLPVYDIMFLKP